MKYCPKCEQTKRNVDFTFDKSTKDGLYGWCQLCKRARDLTVYQANEKHGRTNRAEQRKQRQRWFDSYRSTLKCIQCGFNHPGALQFHHRDREIKLYNISELVSRAYAIDTILTEIEKCDVLCANCHFVFHFEQRRLS